MSRIPKATHKVRKSVLELMDICHGEMKSNRRSLRTSIKLLSQVLSLLDKLHPPLAEDATDQVTKYTVKGLKESKSILGIQTATDFGYEDAV